MRSPALGETVTHLAGLFPCAASLVSLTRSPTPSVWEEVRTDPGCVLLIVRQAGAVLSTPALSFFPALLHQGSVLEGAVQLLEQPGGFVDWNLPTVQPIYRASLSYAYWASALAERSGRCDPDNAWVAGLLAPLGWLAVAAVAPEQTEAVLGQKEQPNGLARLQARLWGFDQAGIARRLARRWRLPPWLAAIVGHLGLPVETAQTVGADPDLFRIVQLAVGLVQRYEAGLSLPIHGEPDTLAAALDMAVADLQAVCGEWEAWTAAMPLPITWRHPQSEPLLRDLLRLAAENRRLTAAPVLERLESDVDQLHRALEEQRTGEAERLQTLKLRGLAEFAAGAGHEINNPLAVISGQAQYLLGHDTDPVRQRSLQTIIKQAQRIHDLLNELMQFARPSRPQKQPVDVGSLIREVKESLSELAAQQRVQLVCLEPEHRISLYGDPRQLRTILACLLRNAIEAAPADGWAGVRLEVPQPDRLHLMVEDSGSGPTPAQREHLFDPFYSGRHAGRGRGLGLSTAWRLAREHGGDVAYEYLPTGPTRFVLSLPWETGCNGTAANGTHEHPPEVHSAN